MSTSARSFSFAPRNIRTRSLVSPVNFPFQSSLYSLHEQDSWSLNLHCYHHGSTSYCIVVRRNIRLGFLRALAEQVKHNAVPRPELDSSSISSFEDFFQRPTATGTLMDKFMDATQNIWKESRLSNGTSLATWL